MFSYHFSTTKVTVPKHLRYAIFCRWKNGSEKLMPTEFKTENEACAGAFGMLVTLGDILEYVGVVCPLSDDYLKMLQKYASSAQIAEYRATEMNLKNREDCVIIDT